MVLRWQSAGRSLLAAMSVTGHQLDVIGYFQEESRVLEERLGGRRRRGCRREELRATAEVIDEHLQDLVSRQLRRLFADSASRQTRARPKRGGGLEIDREIRR